MAGNWELKAIHEQFDVFNDLKEPHFEVPLSNISQLTNKVSSVRSKHLLLGTNEKTSTVKHIVAELMKRSPENENNIKFSFIVIIMNKRENRRLCKMPVFCVKTGNKTIFIDMNCSFYLTWDGFLEGNDLPACKFCFPVDGKYNVGGKLKIDFADSPATLNMSRVLQRVGFCLVSGVVIAGSYFFKIQQSAFNHAKNLVSLAQTFWPGFSGDTFQHVINLSQAVQRFRNGNSSTFELMLYASRTLLWFVSKHEKEMSDVWKKVKEELKHLYNFISEKFSSFYYSASESSRHSFLAVTNRVDGELSLIEDQANSQLEAVRENNSLRQSTVNSLAAERNDQVVVFRPSEQTHPNDVQRIFRNCQNEYVLQHRMKDETQSFSEHTNDLLAISHNVATELQNQSLDDIQDIFVGLNSIVQQEYKHRIDTYTAMVNAAREGAGHDIDLEKFNNSLGVVGNPKDHYWKETLKCIQESRLCLQVKAKIKELQKQKRILLIPFAQKKENDVAGLYKSIGIRGAGTFSAEDFLLALSEKMPHFKTDNLVINETNSMILIRSKKYTVFALQEVDETNNTSGGMVCITSH